VVGVLIELSVMRSIPYLALCLVVLLGGCGRNLPPEPPEAVAPQPVSELVARAESAGIVFEWVAPTEDQRGKELKEISGYKIFRKEINKVSDFLDPAVEWQEVGQVQDTHLVKLNQLREEARAQGKPVRRVQIEGVEMRFKFTAGDLKNGQRYAFLIRPFNQSGGEGGAERVVQVIYRGPASEIAIQQFVDPLGYGGDGGRDRDQLFGAI
jgi:hypothetical protein